MNCREDRNDRKGKQVERMEEAWTTVVKEREDGGLNHSVEIVATAGGS